MKKAKLRCPFPYIGGKQRVAKLIWGALGDVDNLIEPFMGSAAVLLARPHPGRIETCNDVNSYISNVWRALKADPEKVAEYADFPISEVDLCARHLWLMCSTTSEEFRHRMRTDPDYYDAKIAGLWIWGQAQWIGSGWCNDAGIRDDGLPSDRRPQLHTGTSQHGRGVHGEAKAPNDKRPILSPGNTRHGHGVHGEAKPPPQQRPLLRGDSGAHGMGVHASAMGGSRPQLADAFSRGRGVHGNDAAGTCEQRRAWLLDWFGRLQDRLRTVRVCCGDWSRVCSSPSVTTRLGTTGIFCMHPDTLVRTMDERQVRVADLIVGTMINPGRKVLDKFSRHHTGKMLHIKVQGVPDLLKITPEHRVLSIPGRPEGTRQDFRTNKALWESRATVRADELKLGDYMLIPTRHLHDGDINWEWRTESKARGTIRPLEFKPGRHLMRVIGYYAAEGHIVYKNRPYGRAPAAVVFTFNLDEMHTHVRDLCECLKYTFGVDVVGKQWRGMNICKVSITSVAIAEFLARYVPGISTTKKLHPDLMSADPEFQRHILMAWLRGDGGTEQTSRNRFKLLGTSASKQLAVDFYTIAIRLGLRPSFKYRRRNHDVYFASEDAVNLGYTVPAKSYRSGRRIISGHILSRVRSVEAVDYDGPVYDIDVSGDDFFSAPYVLIHNCDPPYALDAQRMHDWVRHLDGRGPVPASAGKATNRNANLYGSDKDDVDHLVARVHVHFRELAKHPLVRVVLAGYAGEHDDLEQEGWEAVAWKGSGYGNRTSQGLTNASKERLWYSPNCMGREIERRPMFSIWDKERELASV